MKLSIMRQLTDGLYVCSTWSDFPELPYILHEHLYLCNRTALSCTFTDSRFTDTADNQY